MDWIRKAQEELDRADIDGWLLYDFRGSNPVANGLIGPLLDGGMASRRVFLMLPRARTRRAPSDTAAAAADAPQPTLLVHAIERGSVPPLPFEVRAYSSRASLLDALRELVGGARTVAMEYSPMGDNPYVGLVDAGTIELVRSLGVEVVPSADVAQVLSRWTPAQIDAHLDAADVVMAAKDHAFAFMAERLSLGQQVREAEVQKVITTFFEERGYTEGHPSDVSFGAHAGDPHYVVREGQDAVLRDGDVVLVDLWAKRAGDPDAPFADVTWMGACGRPSQELVSAFEAVKEARDAAFKAIADAYATSGPPEGAAIDRAARAVLERHGHGEAFFHRTGHSLGTKTTHGEAAHLDDYETSEHRRLLPGVGVTIEPGVYYEHFGVRSEINVLLEDDGPRATTDMQEDLERLPAPAA